MQLTSCVRLERRIATVDLQHAIDGIGGALYLGRNRRRRNGLLRLLGGHLEGRGSGRCVDVCAGPWPLGRCRRRVHLGRVGSSALRSRW